MLYVMHYFICCILYIMLCIIIIIYNHFYQGKVKFLLMYLIEQTPVIESVPLFNVFHTFPVFQ